uniref:Uncharacterized protein n=1 Tax=Glossina austeni TaxID=7395 RepID=A0A1A9VIQ9_GLOAU
MSMVIRLQANNVNPVLIGRPRPHRSELSELRRPPPRRRPRPPRRLRRGGVGRGPFCRCFFRLAHVAKDEGHPNGVNSSAYLARYFFRLDHLAEDEGRPNGVNSSAYIPPSLLLFGAAFLKYCTAFVVCLLHLFHH